MARFGFVGPSYRSRSVNADCQQTLNWYPEVLESGAGKSALAMYQSPGLKLAYALPGEVEVLGLFEFNGRVWAAGNNSLYELFAGGNIVQKRGDFTNGVANGQPVAMAANQAGQLLVAAGGNLYVFNLNTNIMVPVDMTQLNGPVDQIAFVDTYFVAVIRNSNIFQLSNLLDGTVWLKTLDASNISVFPENIVAMSVAYRQIWFQGNKKTTAYFNTGDPSFPFSPLPSGFMEQGAVAKWGSVLLDNTGFWIGGDERGYGIAWRANGYTPQRVSTHAIEFAWQGYSRIDDAVAYAYQDQGHTFYQVWFPSANATWVYDAATQMWHEKAFWDQATGRFTAHRTRCHALGFGKHLVGDWKTGNIYDMSISYLNDFGNSIRRVRRSPHISKENEWQRHFSLQIDMEAGATPQAIFKGNKPATTFTLDDGTGQLWLIAVNDAGNLTSNKLASGVAQIVILNDPSNSTSWQLGVQPVSGNITTSDVSEGGFDTGEFDVILFDSGGTPGSFPVSINMVSITGTVQYVLTVTTLGLLQTTSRGFILRGPFVGLRWSDDGGHTWSNYHYRDAGMAGQFKKRVIFRRLGRTRDRVYELSTSDEFSASIVDAYLKATDDFIPTERIGDRLRKMA